MVTSERLNGRGQATSVATRNAVGACTPRLNGDVAVPRGAVRPAVSSRLVSSRLVSSRALSRLVFWHARTLNDSGASKNFWRGVAWRGLARHDTTRGVCVFACVFMIDATTLTVVLRCTALHCVVALRCVALCCVVVLCCRSTWFVRSFAWREMPHLVDSNLNPNHPHPPTHSLTHTLTHSLTLSLTHSVKSRNLEIENQKSKIKNQKSKIENRKSKIENRKSKIENRKSKKICE